MEIQLETDSLSHIDKKRKLNDSEPQSIPVPFLPSESPETPQDDISYAFPIARIKKLMQNVTDETIRATSIHMMCKAAVLYTQELFLSDLATKSYRLTQANKKKTVRLEDLMNAIANNANLEFVGESKAVRAKETSRESIEEKMAVEESTAMEVDNV